MAHVRLQVAVHHTLSFSNETIANARKSLRCAAVPVGDLAHYHHRRLLSYLDISGILSA